MDLIPELTWRGMYHDAMPGTAEHLATNAPITGYIGFDPTAASLHIGNLATIMLLVHLQRAGHRPVALVGGATGMIGDPSGKSAERNLLDEATLRRNQDGIRAQLEKFLDFSEGPTGALVVNNYDWFKDFGFLQFLREVGKHLTVNYMMAKDSVKRRIGTADADASDAPEQRAEGISYTEFSYQLLQGYDFVHLNKTLGCTLQMGASDQWGNITTGTELIRRLSSAEGREAKAYALTGQLITKADGTKYGKSETGTVWLDPTLTSPYQFYQFFYNAADVDAPRLIRVFTLFSEPEILALEAEHAQAPHLRVLQKALARDVTTRVHSAEATEAAIAASEVLFGKGDLSALQALDEAMLLDVFAGVPHVHVLRSDLPNLNAVSLLSDATLHKIFPSKGEAKKMIQAGGVSINREKVASPETLAAAMPLLAGKYLVVQKGKKNYFLVELM
ncbi:tyrosine--tRNA ligase [Hymenobacter sp. BT770]|uniref:tyrosine--tRNA ligase n=1 Tax=Hymenobacter sp. BT770 TaxID=2886942 RepID=UPI001D0FAB50|nr:tyrosine--tRNA ligase [Hymenobacter sp. BT770]MCC3153000.1 tyrosine--tRNA ligase [Hymenobacter sp. BT770]MDO3415087.1 tyrosine--tRNA ligase [Hymenobacter sp. BT770]